MWEAESKSDRKWMKASEEVKEWSLYKETSEKGERKGGGGERLRMGSGSIVWQ